MTCEFYLKPVLFLNTNSAWLNYTKFYYVFRASGLVGLQKRVGRLTSTGRKHTHFTDEEMESQMSLLKKPQSC